MTTVPALYVAAPAVEPYRFGLFSATVPIAPDDLHWLIGGVEWESLASYATSFYPAGITACNPGTPGDKALDDSVPTSTAWPFAVLGGIECGSVGRPQREFLDRARAVVELGAQHAAETALWSGTQDGDVRALTGVDGSSDPLAYDLTPTPGTAVGIVQAVGLLERWVADNYNGRAILHAPRDVASVADSWRQVHRDDVNDVLNSTVGSRWVFGGGYDGSGPGGVAAADGTAWVFVTGQILMARGDVFGREFAEVLDRSTNTLFAIAEQPYIIGIDGPWAAVLVDTTG